MRLLNQFAILIILSSSVLHLLLNREALGQTSRLPHPQPLSSSEHIRPKHILKGTTLKERCNWYREKLGAHIEDIKQAAQQEKIPPQLLMAVILNEMADVGFEDITQDQQLAATEGNFRRTLDPTKPALWWKRIGEQSFGIAQITPKTAIKYYAVQVPGSERLSRDYVEYQVAYRLLNRRTAIYAAAKVVKGLLKAIEKNQDGAWAKQFIRPGQRFSASDPYKTLHPKESKAKIQVEKQRERALAYLLIAAYNSEGILTAPSRDVPTAYNYNEPKSFPNALSHAHTSLDIADDIYESYACGLGVYKVWDSIKKGEEEGFKILSVSHPSTIINGGKAGDLEVTYSGNPVFPVTVIYRPKPGWGCPQGGCTTVTYTFHERQNPLIFKGALWCRGYDKSNFFNYEVLIKDNKGRVTLPVPAGFNCIVQ